MTSEIYLTPTGHANNCDWHVDQYPWECTCGFIPRKKAMDDLIAQDADLIDKLRDEDSYYRLQEKHWCIDAEELERQRLAAADRIEALKAENARLRDVIDVIWVEASTMRDASKLIGPYPTQPEKNRIWVRSVCHIGKRLMELIRPVRAALGEKQ